MPSFDESLINHVVPRLPEAGRRVCVGFSGGLDSTVLLHLLHALRDTHGLTLTAVHVHHGLSPHADDWAEHCVALCERLGVGLKIVRVAVERDDPRGLEAAAREARHAVLAQQDADWIALAHHADDQAETVLLRLMRGAGVRGLAAMRELDVGRRLWRPLLGVSRATLQDYALLAGLQWIEDESNDDVRFARNAVRREVMPVLAQRWPAVAQLGQVAQHMADAEALLSALAQIDLAAVQPGTAGARERLRGLERGRVANLLRFMMSGWSAYLPPQGQLEEMLRQLLGDAAAIRLVWGAMALCAYRDGFWSETAAIERAVRQRWAGETEMACAGGMLRFTPAEGEAALRLVPDVWVDGRQAGDRLRLHAGGPARALKQLAQENGVPPWRRDGLPVLRGADGNLLWVAELGTDVAARCGPGEAGWLVRWERA